MTEQAAEVRRRIGLVGQNAAVDEVLSGRQNLVMFGRLHHLGRRAAAARADELLAEFGLSGTGAKPVSAYSGGMRRRLDLAVGVILAPQVLFLDEPTVGLDPRGRGEVWQAIRDLAARGTTVLLTTQYLDEADQLATQINVMDHGRVIAEGSPGELKSRLGGDRIEFVVHDRALIGTAARAVAPIGVTDPAVDPDAGRVSVQVSDGTGTLQETVRALDRAGVAVDDLTLRRPTLDEVFLHLTGGRSARSERAAEPGKEVNA